MSPVVVKMLKVIGYIFVSTLIAVLASSEFRAFIEDYPEVLLYVPIVNVLLVAVAKWLEGKLPEESKVKGIL